MAGAKASSTTDRCELCSQPVDGAFAAMRHLRTMHPSYARSVALRMAAPFVFLVSVLVFSLAHAPQAAYVAALMCAFGVMVFGKVGSRAARVEAGATPTLGIARLAREGGLWIVLFVPLLLGALLLLAGR